jgi:hypothetical protein
MPRTADIIAFAVASLGSSVAGWAAVHIAAKVERQRAIHVLEKYGPALNQVDNPRQARRVSRVMAAFYPAPAENDPKP